MSVVGDVGIAVKTEHFWTLVEGKRRDVVEALLKGAVRGCEIIIKHRELVAFLHNLSTEILFQHSIHATHILLICNTTPVVDLGNQVVQSDVWDLVLRLQVL